MSVSYESFLSYGRKLSCLLCHILRGALNSLHFSSAKYPYSSFPSSPFIPLHEGDRGRAGIHYDYSGCPIEAFGHDRNGDVSWNNANVIRIMLSLVNSNQNLWLYFFHVSVSLSIVHLSYPALCLLHVS